MLESVQRLKKLFVHLDGGNEHMVRLEGEEGTVGQRSRLLRAWAFLFSVRKKINGTAFSYNLQL